MSSKFSSSCFYHSKIVHSCTRLAQFSERRPPVRPLSSIPVAAPEQTLVADSGSDEETVLDTDIISSWTAEERNDITNCILQAFLSSNSTKPGKRTEMSSGSAKGGNHRNPAGQKKKKKTPPGQTHAITRHLVKGKFDDEFLSMQTTTALNWAIQLLGRQRRLDLAEQLFHWMRLKQIANEHTFVQFCEACELSCNPVKALQTWRNLRRFSLGRGGVSIPFGAYAAAALLKPFRAAGNLELTLKTLQELQRTCTPLNRYAYNIALRACADAAAFDEALALLEQIRALKSADSYPDQRTYSAMLSCIAVSNRWNRTSKIHAMLEEDCISIDGPLLLQLLHCYAGAGLSLPAQDVFDRMSMAGNEGCAPNRSHWNALMSCYARDLKRCLETYHLMVDRCRSPPDSYTLVAVLSAASHDAKQGLSIVNWALSEIQRHSIVVSVHLGTAMISVCRHAPPEDCREALALAHAVFAAMKTRAVHAVVGDDDDDYAENASMHSTSHHNTTDQEKKEVGKRVRRTGRRRNEYTMKNIERGPSIATYNALLMVHDAFEDYQGAFNVFKEVEESPDLIPNDITLGIMIGMCRKARGMEEKVCEFEELRATLLALHGEECSY